MQYKEQIETMISIISSDIRNNWSGYVDERLDAIVELCTMIDRYDWIEEINENREHIRDDGRWMRGSGWSGPYGAHHGDMNRYIVGNELFNEYYDVLLDPSMWVDTDEENIDNISDNIC